MPNYSRMTKQQLLDHIRGFKKEVAEHKRFIRALEEQSHADNRKFIEKDEKIAEKDKEIAERDAYVKRWQENASQLRRKIVDHQRDVEACVDVFSFLVKIYYPRDEHDILHGPNMDKTRYENMDPLPRAFRIVYATLQGALENANKT